MAPVLYHNGRFPPPTLDWPALIPLRRLETPSKRSPHPSALRFFCALRFLPGAWPNTRPLWGKYVTPSHGGSKHPAPIIGCASILH
jgi:hypothetical protein